MIIYTLPVLDAIILITLMIYRNPFFLSLQRVNADFNYRGTMTLVDVEQFALSVFS